MSQHAEESAAAVVIGLWGVPYQARDVSRSIDVYTRHLGFNLDAKHPPAFAQVQLEDPDGNPLELVEPAR